jgi:hypothetical protein
MYLKTATAIVESRGNLRNKTGLAVAIPAILLHRPLLAKGGQVVLLLQKKFMFET